MKSHLIQLILACIICAAAVAGYGILYGTIASTSAAAAVLQNQIDIKNKATNRMATTRSALAEIVEDETVVQNYFISQTGVVAFIDGLEALGRPSGATTTSLSVSAGGTSAQPTLTLTLSIKGTFDAVMRTVGAIEYAPYAISISSLSVGQEAKGLWHADLTLVVRTSITSTP